MKIIRQLVSTVSIVVITLNLIFWLMPLMLVQLLILLIPTAGIKSFGDKFTAMIYRGAVLVDHLWLTKVLGIKVVTHGIPLQHKQKQYFVISNHQSWFDILILQSVISENGPLLKFLVKQSLIYVPVIGWICIALKFPRLHRSTDKSLRKQDYTAITTASISVDGSPFALLNFVEGTRFTKAKQAQQLSPYQYLLKPKAGGFKIVLNQLPDVEIIDATLIYPSQTLNFWDCLSGKLKRIDVHLEYYTAAEIHDDSLQAHWSPEHWLQERWQEKDRLIVHSLAPSTVQKSTDK